MYKPPQRISFPPAPGVWPTATQAKSSRLFSPISTGRLTLTSRTWVPAMVPWRATEDGYVNDDVIAWYSRFAEGKPGAIVVEATGIRDVPSGPLLRIGDDRFIPGLEKLVAAVRQASGGETKLFIQLIDFLSIRRRPKREDFLKRFLTIADQYRDAIKAASDDDLRDTLIAMDDARLKAVLTPRDWESLSSGFRERVTDVEKPHIQQLPQSMPILFKNAAVRAQAAGFDGVELHYAHAYTMASFLSALNSRTDGYGGSRENRVRLPLEVYRAVRGALADSMIVGCRFLAEECIEGGSDVSDTEWFAEQFAAAGMDFLSLSRGGKFEDALQPKPGEAAYPYTGPSGYECMPQYLSDEKGPYGRNSAAGKRIRSAVRQAGHRTPFIVAGGVHGFEMAERMLAEEVTDIVASARQSLADPDWWEKMRSGRGGETRVCEFTNYCEGLDQKHKQVTCQLWDREGVKVPNVALSSDGKRRLTAPAWTKSSQ